ncbi:AI-2E family transporter [bacterium]|nr:AI-2E family transporter [bacterium]
MEKTADDPASKVDVPRVVLGTIVVLGVASGFWLVFKFSGPLCTLSMAMVLGTSVRPWLEWLHRRGLSRWTSALLAYAALLALVVAILVLVMPVLIEQATAFAANLPSHLDSVRRRLQATSSLTLHTIAAALPTELTLSSPGELATPPKHPTLADLGWVAKGIFTIAAILVLSFYWTLEGEVTIRASLLVFGLERRERLRELVEAAEARVGWYVRGQLVVSFVTTVLSFIAFALIGLPDALVLALLAGVAGVLPVFGAPVAAAPALLLALSVDPGLVPPVLLAATVIHLVQEYVVAPRVLGKSIGVHPFTILLAISGFSSLLGFAGALVAIPAAAIVQLLLERLVFDGDEPSAPPRRDRLSVLRLEARQLALDVRRQGRDKPDELTSPLTGVEDMVESIANDVDKMLSEAGSPDPSP